MQPGRAGRTFDEFDANGGAIPMSTGPDRSEREAPRPGRRWEYHTCEVDHPMSAGMLDALGRRGWRLAGIVKFGGLLTYTFLRRQPRSTPP
jgi:hypothetical protein